MRIVIWERTEEQKRLTNCGVGEMLVIKRDRGNDFDSGMNDTVKAERGSDIIIAQIALG